MIASSSQSEGYACPRSRQNQNQGLPCRRDSGIPGDTPAPERRTQKWPRDVDVTRTPRGPCSRFGPARRQKSAGGGSCSRAGTLPPRNTGTNRNHSRKCPPLPLVIESGSQPAREDASSDSAQHPVSCGSTMMLWCSSRCRTADRYRLRHRSQAPSNVSSIWSSASLVQESWNQVAPTRRPLMLAMRPSAFSSAAALCAGLSSSRFMESLTGSSIRPSCVWISTPAHGGRR